MYLSREKYVLTSVERILSRFGVDKTISAEPVLHVINSVACQQIFVNLLDTWTDPKRLSRALRALLLDDQTEAASTLGEGSFTIPLIITSFGLIYLHLSLI